MNIGLMKVVGKTLKILWNHCEYLSILENLLAFPNEIREPLNLVCGHILASEENLWTFVVNIPHFGHRFHFLWISLSLVCELFLASEESLWAFVANVPNFLTLLRLFLKTIQLRRTSQLFMWAHFSIWRKSLNFCR